MHERTAYRVTARIVLIEERGLLLVRHSHPDGRDFWCFPGGSVERGERVAEAARREAREELGIAVELLGVCHLQEIDNRGPVLDVFFRARRRQGEVRLGRDPEHAGGEPVLREAAWVPLGQLRERQILPADLARTLAASGGRSGAVDGSALLPLN